MATVIPAVVALAIATATSFQIHKDSKKRTKIASAQMILKLKEPWHKPELKALLKKIQNNTVGQDDKVLVEEYLNQMEDIAAFTKDGVLTKEHVKEMFGANLKYLMMDGFARAELLRWHELNPQYTFVNLVNLLDEAKYWDM